MSLETHQRLDTEEPVCSSKLGLHLAGLRFVLCWGLDTTAHETGQHPVVNVALRWWGYVGRTQESEKIISEDARGGAGGKQAAGLP